MQSFLEKIHNEISQTQRRRHHLNILKIAFVTALLGFGGIEIKNLESFYATLYLVPLIAVFFDLLAMGEHFSIRRMGAFLRLHSPDPIEKKYEKFVAEHRDRFFNYGSVGFTVLSYIAAVALLTKAKQTFGWFDYFWFVAIFMIFIATRIVGRILLAKLDSMGISSDGTEA